jgi:sodium transport system ATP-binding protein
MLYALLRPDSGRVTVDGIDAALQPLEVRRRLGVLPDARGLYKRLSARENIAYFAQLHGMEPQLIRQRSDALIQALAMQDIAERRVEGFSQGERVKTAIARALVHDPRHIVLDEPTNGLDVMATRGLRDFLRQLKSEGRCVLFSTHIMQEVAALCDRIVIIAGGRVVADGTPEALRELAGEHSLEEAFVKLIGNAGVGELA